MKIRYRTIGVAVVSIWLLLTTGCDTLVDVLNNSVRINGQPVIKNIIAQLSQQQKDKLQQHSPDTLAKVEHNDDVAKNKKEGADKGTPAPPAEDFTPLTVDDIKALDSAGVKKDVIIAEIERSKSVYTEADITALKQSNPNIDPTVIECMKSHHN